MTGAAKVPKDLMDVKAGEQCLLEVAAELDAAGLPFFLMQGTALGAYRDGGFTPTERDIDLGFLYEEFAPLAVDLANKFSFLRYKVEWIAKPFQCVRTLKLQKPGVRMDLVSLARWRDKRFCANADPALTYALVHEAQIIENWEPLELFGRTFYVPSPIEIYLAREYGEGWKTPAFDSVSRTRVYDFVKKNGIPHDFLN